MMNKLQHTAHICKALAMPLLHPLQSQLESLKHVQHEKPVGLALV